MVRLQGQNEGLEMGGKRSRPTSSLDYKADRSDPKLFVDTSPAGGGVNGRSSSKTERQQQQQQQQSPPGGASSFDIVGTKRQMNPTRARGSGGIPMIPRTLADLHGMTQEEMMEALYNDPALAEQLKAATEQHQQEKQQQQNSDNNLPPEGHTRRSASKSSGSSFIKSRDRAGMLKEQGVPYQQWGILLVLLGLALYQIYKAYKPPGSGKSKGGKNRGKSSTSTKIVIDDEVVAELEGSVAKVAAPASAALKKAKKKKASTQKPSSKTSNAAYESSGPTVSTLRLKKAPEIETQIIFEEELVDEGEWKTVANHSAPKGTSGTKPLTTATVAVADDAVTVHTSNTSSKKKKKNGAAPTKATKSNDAFAPQLESSVVSDETPSLASVSQETAVASDVKQPHSMNGSSAPAPVVEESVEIAPSDSVETPSLTNEVSAAPTEGKAEAKKKKIKKKKEKNGTVDTGGLSNGSTTATSHDTDADAALAQQLQQEEDKQVREEEAAKSAATVTENGEASDDVWAEVTKKKKQPKVSSTGSGESEEE